MKIIIDGQKLPLDVRVTRDILALLKGISRMLNWGVLYDTARETVYINSKNSATPTIQSERLAPSDDGIESTRLSGKKICIDPGHGGSDPGAIGPTGTQEKENTLAISLLLRDKLEKNGARVTITRETDKDVSFPDSSSGEELGARVAIANESGADIFVSIHNDAFTNPEAVGTTTFHYGDSDSIRLAECIQSSLSQGLGTHDRGARFASFYVIRHTKMPAILVEVAFISNPEEEILLSSVNGRFNASENIYQGIVKYFRV